MQTAAGRGYDLQERNDAPGSRALKNPQHEKLAREYAAGASKAEAWRAIGRDPTIGNQSRTFQRADIQARVEYFRGEFNRMAGVSLAALQARLLRMADANVVNFFEASEGGRLKLRDLTKLSEAATAPITELNIDKDGAVKVKVADKLHAVDSLLKTIGGFDRDAQSSSGTTLEDLVRASMGNSDTRVAFQVVTGVPRSPDGPPAGPEAANSAAAASPGVRQLQF
jgi:hypothetical protein